MESKNSDDLKDKYVLEYLNVSSGRGTIPTATARVAFDGKSAQEASCGDGAVDAATKAIDRIVGYKITIENFHIDSVTEGREAQGRVSVVARSSEGVFTGTATSTDIVEASALAYMNVINKIARMKLFNRKLPSQVVESDL
jgi:2-isopropylmalate synthase